MRTTVVLTCGPFALEIRHVPKWEACCVCTVNSEEALEDMRNVGKAV